MSDTEESVLNKKTAGAISVLEYFVLGATPSRSWESPVVIKSSHGLADQVPVPAHAVLGVLDLEGQEKKDLTPLKILQPGSAQPQGVEVGLPPRVVLWGTDPPSPADKQGRQAVWVWATPSLLPKPASGRADPTI